MFRTPERRGVAMALAAALAILGGTLLSAKVNSSSADTAPSVRPKVVLH